MDRKVDFASETLVCSRTCRRQSGSFSTISLPFRGSILTFSFSFRYWDGNSVIIGMEIQFFHAIIIPSATHMMGRKVGGDHEISIRCLFCEDIKFLSSVSFQSCCCRLLNVSIQERDCLVECLAEPGAQQLIIIVLVLLIYKSPYNRFPQAHVTLRSRAHLEKLSSVFNMDYGVLIFINTSL